MAKLLLKLLALLPVLAVAPASASHLANAVGHSDCAFERAELVSAGYQPIDASVVGAPADGSLFDPGPAFLP